MENTEDSSPRDSTAESTFIKKVKKQLKYDYLNTKKASCLLLDSSVGTTSSLCKY